MYLDARRPWATTRVEGGQHALRVRKQRLTRGRQRRAAASTGEERRTELGLEPLHRRGERGRRQVSMARGEREGAVAGDEQEVPKRIEHR